MYEELFLAISSSESSYNTHRRSILFNTCNSHQLFIYLTERGMSYLLVQDSNIVWKIRFACNYLNGLK